MIEYLIISLVFFFLGKYSQTDKMEEIAKKIKKRFRKTPLGTIEAPDQGQIEYQESGRAEVDKIMEEHLK